MNLDFWYTVFRWLEIGWIEKSLQYRGSPTYSMHLHLYLPPGAGSRNNANKALGRIRVGMPGQVVTLFDVLPASAQPNDKTSEALYGFLLRDNRSTDPLRKAKTDLPNRWVRWVPNMKTITLTERFDALCEVKFSILALQNKPFDIKVQRDMNSWVQVRMDMPELFEDEAEKLKDNPQESLDTTDISFVYPFSKDKVSLPHSAFHSLNNPC